MSYQTPGVYVEEISVFPPSVAEVETAIPAFIGYTYNDDPNPGPRVERIKSLNDFEKIFGKPGQPAEALVTSTVIAIPNTTDFDVTVTIAPASLPKFILYYAVQMFYANGGGPCYIVSVGKATAGGSPAKAELSKGIVKIKNYDEPTLLVIPEAIKLVTYTVDPNDASKNIMEAADYASLMQDCITQANDLADRFVIIDVPFDADKMNIETDAANFRGQNLADKYAAAYYPYLKTSINYEIDINQLKFSPTSPDPYKNALLSTQKGSAIYEKVKAELNRQLRVTLPPSSAIAGVYAKVDNERGVWKAPANVLLNYVIEPTTTISLQDQKSLNVDPGKGQSINAIRYVTGVGLAVWGARTLDGNSREWKYINVRRFFNMVEESVQKSTMWAVFEPNTKNTWVKVKGMIESYLLSKWIDGALAGAKPEDAFYVKVGLPETMRADEIEDGIMKVVIGMAVSRPAEFIVLQFLHKIQVS